MKVLIVKLSAFGDIIHAQPAMELLRQQGMEVHWLVDARYAFVTELFPADVQVHVVALKGEQRLQHAWQSIQALRHYDFDAVLDLQGLIKSGLMARAIARTAPVYGFDAAESPEWPNRYLVKPVTFQVDDRHVVQKYCRIALAVMGQGDQAIAYSAPKLDCGTRQQQAAATVVEAWQGQPHTVLHVGGGWQTKRMDIQQWRACVVALAERGAAITLSWGDDEEFHRAKAIADCYELATVLPERLDIHTLAGVLHAAQAVIGMDTGVLHLAAALGTPTITLWGPSASWNAGPQGSSDAHVESNPSCGPCFQRRCERFVCMPSIQAASIIQAWERVKR
jgi:heptosyltransferase-1